MSTGGVRDSEHPDIILFPINTLSRLAEQCVLRCRADLSGTRLQACMHCQLLRLEPHLVKTRRVQTLVFLKSQLCGGWVPFAACVLWLPRASLVSSSSVSCLLCGGGLLGLGEGHQACKSTEISHTSWRIFKLFLCIQCIDIVLGAHHLSPRSTWCTPQGFSEPHRLFPQFSLAHPPWGSNPRPQG